ncbi:Putative exonuclease SbcCD, C subunit [Streptomyces sp. cf386]|uniref:SbcC/MukB-like Walker B domain-containing protein n=1 Tax=Streptomyces sp. cf386 TaxID=1761904 RepID=UPI00088DEC82|nr:SbcC/MukB-like Walker B domain-containing protein [Streptomyces sp. cf386]SDP61834.1 Putative exonuclease SbcCD, C subunit [Streptomyces sp. cf386]
MTTEHPALHLSLTNADAPVVGTPTAEGRWQPTRAGIVNSWAWASEQLYFSDGWLALVGPNGSGKSLTASMLVTVLLDADTSQTALSVSGKAAGTLTSRHTDFNDREDRTGIWWLEYGLHDQADGTTQYMTTGLWLRATAGDMHRAFFLAPGRVGTDLILEQDREPVGLDALAGQLAACQGEMFTNSKALRGSLTKLTPQDERSYRHNVRTRLFAPLNEVQFEALLAVLRSLRSVRTAEAISPTRMRQVLTDALPALDTDNLTQVAEAMERISELEDKLERTRQEAKLLDGTDRSYRRYLRTVAQVEAAALTAANTEFDDHARDLKKATDQLDAAQQASKEAAQEFDHVQSDISRTRGHLSADEALLSEHAGAELPHHEERARDLAAQAEAAAERAQTASTDADEADRKAASSRTDAQAAQTQLTRISGDLRTTASALGAQAACEHLMTASAALAAARTGADAVLDTAWLCSHPLAWAEDHQRQIQAVDRALRSYEHLQGNQRTAADEQHAAEDAEHTRREAAGQATRDRRRAEEELCARLQEWQEAAPLLGPLPPQLTEPGDMEERTDTSQLTAWLASAAAAARARIDLPGHQQKAAADGALAQAAARIADQARIDHAAAREAADEAGAAHEAALEQAHAEAEADENRRAQAHRANQQTRRDAQTALDAAEQAHAGADAAALQSVRDWLGQVHAWRDGLTHLSADDLPLPHPTALAADLHALRPADLTLLAVRAHAQATPRLQHQAEQAARQAQAVTETVSALTEQLHQAQQSAPIPSPPAWRTRTDSDSVPLWALVDFAPGLGAADADRLEGALLVAGLLDALVTPDGRVCDGDLTLTPTMPAAQGRTLADLLVVEDTPAIDTARVREILSAIPLDAPGSNPATGRLAHGVLTASAPAGYRAAFIGRTTRERARQQRVRRLEDDLAVAHSTLTQAEGRLSRRRQDITEAAAERDSLPPAACVDDARRQAADRRAAADALKHSTATALADADRALERILAELAAAAATRTATVSTAALTHEHARASETRAAGAAQAATETAAEQAAAAQASEDARARAAAAQQAADTEHEAFPYQAIEAAETAHTAEDAAEQHLNRARAEALKTTSRHEDASKAVSEALRALNRAAALPAGDMLRTEPDYLDARRETAVQLVGHIQAWAPAAQRVTDLLARADSDHQEGTERRTRHTRAEQEAARSQRRAEEEAATVAEMRALHGAEYRELLTRRDATDERLKQAEARAEQCRSRQQEADKQASAAQATLMWIAPQRETAEKNRDICMARLGRLVDERLADVPDDLPTTAGRPANLTAGLAWARRLLTDAPGGTDRRTALERQRDRDLALLETAARKASTGLAGFDRQVTLESIEDTPWRRALVADPAVVRGQDVPTTVQDLKATAAQLEDDLRVDIKQVLKTSLFTRLQRDIQLRRQAAVELVARIHDTLKDVRTGVAHVGVQVEWDVRDNPEAQRMVELIGKPPSDDTFEQMYDALRQRMDEKAGEPWAERVAHTFDYRSWYDWTISVTHASFEAAGKEKFREITARSNPLEALSTGERRLATMLPLLAAAWSMYSARDYAGPRLLSIDEIDAAFDERNLRKILALLRSWDFDVLATAPSMTPLIKRETQRAMVHEVVTAGRRRITVPWLWHGHGEPQPLTLEVPAPQPQDTP